MVEWITIYLDYPYLLLVVIFILTILSGSILPLGSEIFLITYVLSFPHLAGIALVTATLGNTLGGYLSYWLGQLIHQGQKKWQETSGNTVRARWMLRAAFYFEKYGAKSLIFSWLPVVGDFLCVLAGWRQLPMWQCIAYMLVGKFVRYLMVIAIVWT